VPPNPGNGIVGEDDVRVEIVQRAPKGALRVDPAGLTAELRTAELADRQLRVLRAVLDYQHAQRVGGH